MATLKELCDRRKQIYDKMSDNSILILYAGVAPLKNNELYYEFEVNKNFYYLTGISEENAVFMAIKQDGMIKEEIFIKGFDPRLIKFTGRTLSFAEATQISGIDEIFGTSTFAFELDSYMNGTKGRRTEITTFYLDVNDSFLVGPNKTTQNVKDALELNYRIQVKNIANEIVRLRNKKIRSEILLIDEATKKMNQGLKHVLKNLKPGVSELQIERTFMNYVKDLGRGTLYRRPFVGTGKNVLSYVNRRLDETCENGGVLIIDAAVKEDFYVSSIARTYPVSGKFNEIQKRVYQILLDSVDKILGEIKPGVGLSEINEIFYKNLLESTLNSKISVNLEILKRSIPHILIEQIGLEEKEPFLPQSKIEEGYVLTLAPAIFLDEYKLAMRIKDVAVVTSEGAYLLSNDDLRTIEDIERAMKSRN